jgi:hypothetical protein
MIQAGGNILHSEIHKLINSIWNKEELPEQWKETIVVHICKKGDKIDCSNYMISVPVTNCIINFIQYSSPNVKSIHNEITGDHQYG